MANFLAKQMKMHNLHNYDIKRLMQHCKWMKMEANKKG